MREEEKTQQRKHSINSFTFLHHGIGCGNVRFFSISFSHKWRKTTEFLISFNVSNVKTKVDTLGYEARWQCDKRLLITIGKLLRKKLFENAQVHVLFFKYYRKTPNIHKFPFVDYAHKNRLKFLFAFVHLSHVNINLTSDQRIWNIYGKSLSLEHCANFVFVPMRVCVCVVKW